MKDIVFDLGGVLIDWNPRHLYKKIFSTEEEMEWFLANVCHGAWNAKQDAGRPFSAALAEAKEKYPKYAAQIEAYFFALGRNAWRSDKRYGPSVKRTESQRISPLCIK